MLDEDFLRDAGGFLSEHDVVVRAEVDVAVDLAALRGRKPELRRLDDFLRPVRLKLVGEVELRMLREEVLVVEVLVELELRPVVHARTLDVAVVEGEAVRPDHMKRRVGRHAGATDRTRVKRNFRFMKHNM